MKDSPATSTRPRWLQERFDRGEVNIALAEKARSLSKEDKAAVRQAMEAGVPAGEAISQRLPKKRQPFVAPARDLDRFVKLGRKAVAALGPRVKQVKSIGDEHAKALREMKEVIDFMLQKASGSLSGAVKVEEASAVVSCERDGGEVDA